MHVYVENDEGINGIILAFKNVLYIFSMLMKYFSMRFPIPKWLVILSKYFLISWHLLKKFFFCVRHSDHRITYTPRIAEVIKIEDIADDGDFNG
jgi:hypothetical protein